ncbi:unnamed protein product, partial [Vitis vinifera]
MVITIKPLADYGDYKSYLGSTSCLYTFFHSFIVVTCILPCFSTVVSLCNELPAMTFLYLSLESMKVGLLRSPCSSECLVHGKTTSDIKTDGFYFLCHHKNSESSVLIGSGPLDVYC